MKKTLIQGTDDLELSMVVTDLLCFISDKYDVRSIDEFTCPIHKRLAELTEWEYNHET
jgi:hypothetical protein